MKLGVELPDEIIKKIDVEAKQDGHNNRSAIIRKALNEFFLSKKTSLDHLRTEKINQR